jgi:hypothetical protein
VADAKQRQLLLFKNFAYVVAKERHSGRIESPFKNAFDDNHLDSSLAVKFTRLGNFGYMEVERNQSFHHKWQTRWSNADVGNFTVTLTGSLLSLPSKLNILVR